MLEEDCIHGHLGLVIPTSKCNDNTESSCQKPPHPGKLQIPNGTAIHDAICICKEYTEKVTLFRETLAVKNTLKSKIMILFTLKS